MAKPWLMGIDIGGSGVRCLLVDTTTGASAAADSPLLFTPAAGTFGTGFFDKCPRLFGVIGVGLKRSIVSPGKRWPKCP